MSKKITDAAKKVYYDALDLFQPLERLTDSFLSLCLTTSITHEELFQRIAKLFSLGAYVFRVLGYAETFFVTVKLFKLISHANRASFSAAAAVVVVDY
jgi:hypothetical protein